MEERTKLALKRGRFIHKKRKDRYQYKDIGEMLGITKQRAWQLHKWYLEKIVDNSLDKSK